MARPFPTRHKFIQDLVILFDLAHVDEEQGSNLLGRLCDQTALDFMRQRHQRPNEPTLRDQQAIAYGHRETERLSEIVCAGRENSDAAACSLELHGEPFHQVSCRALE